jgi:hypothetical protein
MPVFDWKRMIREILPGVVLPGLIYLVVSSQTSVLVGLAAASSVPALDALVRLARGRAPSLVGACFILVTAASVALAMWFQSPLFILVKGAVLSFVVGMAFTISAAIGRPLTRTIAIRLGSHHAEGRRSLRERWHHPKALAVFRTLAIGWGVLLFLSGAQQAALALTLSPGTVMAVEPPVQTVGTLVGIAVSVLYARRHHRRNPELGLIPQRAADLP